MNQFTARVYHAVRGIPEGRVASYGAVATLAGQPGAARQVGRAMAALPDGSDIPWWRVINARGVISVPRSGGVASIQRALLEEEGVAFGGGGRVDMRRYGWSGADPDAD